MPHVWQNAFQAKAFTYKFSRPGYRETFERAFAVDMANVEQLIKWRTHRDRIVLAGNLAIDGALVESAAPVQPGAPDGGILIMPGSRRHEVEQLIPFFFAMALRIHRERPDIPVAFGISPFTSLEDVGRAVVAGGDARMFATAGGLLIEDDAAYLFDAAGTARFPVVRNALSAAKAARLIVTIPGTKTIEVAALGKPMLAITPLNAPELITINGPLTYLDRLPLFGATLKRSAVLAASRRFKYFAQPNIDAGRSLVAELRGTLTPGHVARIALERFDDAAWLEQSGGALAHLHADHIGAAQRMAAGIEEAIA